MAPVQARLTAESGLSLLAFLDIGFSLSRRRLDPAVFWQIHRSTVVNISAIDTIYRSFRGTLEAKLKDRSELLPVSATDAHLFKHP